MSRRPRSTSPFPNRLTLGIDEAGRGPLAGPVVAAAVVLDLSLEWDGLDDSKQLTPEKRAALFARVLNGARAFAWSVAGPRAIGGRRSAW